MPNMYIYSQSVCLIHVSVCDVCVFHRIPLQRRSVHTHFHFMFDGRPFVGLPYSQLITRILLFVLFDLFFSSLTTISPIQWTIYVNYIVLWLRRLSFFLVDNLKKNCVDTICVRKQIKMHTSTFYWQQLNFHFFSSCSSIESMYIRYRLKSDPSYILYLIRLGSGLSFQKNCWPWTDSNEVSEKRNSFHVAHKTSRVCKKMFSNCPWAYALYALRTGVKMEWLPDCHFQ